MGRNPILLSFASAKAMRTPLRLSALSVADALVRPPPPPDGRCYPLHRRQGLWHTSGQLTCVRTCAAGGLFKKGGGLGSGLGRRTARVGSDGVSMAYAARSRSCALRQSLHAISMGRLKADPNRHQPRRRRGCLLSPCLPACLPVPACPCLPACLSLCPSVCVCSLQTQVCLLVCAD